MGTAADFPVKWITSAMPRAPVISGAAGGLIPLLDAFLVTGWGAMTPQRVHVQDGIATVQCAVGDTFEPHVVIEVSGAEQSALNGQHRVLTSSSTGFTFATEADDGFATGVITIKAAPAGWEKAFADENRAAYRSTAPDANQAFLVVNDSSAGQQVPVFGCATLESLDDCTLRFPPEGTSCYWYKSQTSNSSGNGYQLFADPRFLISSITFLPGSKSSFGIACYLNVFGDCAPLFVSGDAFATWITSCLESGNYLQSAAERAGSVGWLAADAAGVTIAPKANVANVCNVDFGALSDLGRIILTPKIISSRALYPGLYGCCQSSVAEAVPAGDTIRARIGGTERVLRAVSAHTGRTYAFGAVTGLVVFVDITGPWR